MLGNVIEYRQKSRAYSTYANSGDQYVVPTILSCVVRTPVSIDAPVAREAGGHAFGARAVRVAIEEGEVGVDEVRPVRHPDRKLRCEMMLSRWDGR